MSYQRAAYAILGLGFLLLLLLTLFLFPDNFHRQPASTGHAFPAELDEHERNTDHSYPSVDDVRVE